MGFWDNNPDVIPNSNTRFFRFETPGQEVIGKVIGMGVHTWPPKRNERTGQMETKKSPEVTYIDAATGAERTTTLQSHAARLAYQQGLDVGDDFQLRFTHKEGTTYKFTLQVTKGQSASAQQVQVQQPLASTGTDSPW